MEWVPVIFGFLGLYISVKYFGISEISIVISGIFGFLGFVIAGLSLLFSYMERRAPLRNALYKKQIEIYEEIIDNIDELYNLLYTFLTKSEKDQNNFNSDFFAKKSVNFIEKFHQKYEKWILFSPNEVIDSIKDNIDIYFEIFDYTNTHPKRITKKQIDVFKDSILAKSNIVTKNIKNALGTVPLSDENQKMLGKMKEKFREQIEQK
ncbi:MAG: hypothetical protein JW984_16895 [Deltaproteobacteria bacterium]|uniref:Uncharacterized protein n=1 Tax=Candidatus Zymogenus saltonus TaxID=2844893 RepID=A0A9D8PPD3_9DELT|nr:hypothetical protein [Candidatus Zymogenus saltonus]